MTSFDGKAITYDAIGNPLTYDGGTFAWEGRKLTSFNKTGLAISYTYNENGIRTSKTVNGIPTTYRLSGDKVTFEQTGSDTIYYVYDTKGQLISMILNNVEYAYHRNAQNDIVGLINSAGVQVVAYTYSTWGEVTLVEDTSAVSLGTKNPYLYRGYRYDSETGIYYLQSRYYNPQWGRFLNADSVSSGGSIVGANVFQYCLNNPVTIHDPSGMWPIALSDLWDSALKTFGLKTTTSVDKKIYELNVNYFFASYSHVKKVSTSSSVGKDKPITFENSISNIGTSSSIVFNHKDSSISFSDGSVSASYSKGLNSYSYELSQTNRGVGLFKTVTIDTGSNTSMSETLGFEVDFINIGFSTVAVLALASGPVSSTLGALAAGSEMVYQLFTAQ